jgi:hypothetical protein
MNAGGKVKEFSARRGGTAVAAMKEVSCALHRFDKRAPLACVP